MDRMKQLDLIFDGHGCTDCEEEIMCRMKDKSGLCDEWELETPATYILKVVALRSGIPAAYLMKDTAEEFAKEIDRTVIERGLHGQA